MVDDSPSIRLVRNYIEASQRARASGKAEDFQALRTFMAETTLSAIVNMQYSLDRVRVPVKELRVKGPARWGYRR